MRKMISVLLCMFVILLIPACKENVEENMTTAFWTKPLISACRENVNEAEKNMGCYSIEDFQTIVVGKTTFQDVYKLFPEEGMIVTSYGGLCNYATESGSICIQFYGSDLVVGAIEFNPKDDAEADDQIDMSQAQVELKQCFPEYFGLDPAKGLDVIVWQMAPSSYSFGVLEHSSTQRDWISKELMDLKGASTEQMREILAAYAVSEDEVYIIPWQNPISSYLPTYCINYGSEDMDAKTEAYIAVIREMLFGRMQ